MIYRVKEPFSFTDSRGVPRVMAAGALVGEGHEAYRTAWLHLYEPVETAAARAVDATETATAEPGEKRAILGDDDLTALRAKAEAAGVKVDNRWGAAKLRSEIQKAEKHTAETDD